jgi:hypothetical protein
MARWGWVLIGVGVVALVGFVGYLLLCMLALAKIASMGGN